MTGHSVAHTTGNAVSIANSDYFGALASRAENLKSGGDGAFMKFSGSDGAYSYGAGAVELPPGTQLVMNPASYHEGWVIWKDGEVAHEQMCPLGQPVTAKSQLPDFSPYGKDDGPKEQITCQFGTLEEPYVNMTFQANNVSKRRAMAALLKAFGKDYKHQADPGSTFGYKFPVVEIDSTTFEVKDPDGGKRKFKKFAPVFKIVGWVSEAEMNTMAEGRPEDYAKSEVLAAEEAAAAPAPQTRRPAPASAPAPTPAPATRRPRF